MTDKSKRDAPFSYRPPKHLRATFVCRVEASGLSVNAFITRAVFGNRRRLAERELLAQIIAEAATIREHFDSIADGGVADHVDEALDDLAVIRAALLKMMERAP